MTGKSGPSSKRTKRLALPASPITEESGHSLAPNGLTRLQWTFIQELVAEPSLNATRAYMKAAPNVTEGSARTEASRMLASPHIKAEVQRLLDERSAITGVRADSIVIRLWQMATADVRDLVEYRIGSCRHCWGLYHQFQYTDAEYEQAQDKHIREQAAARKKKPDHAEVPFSGKGGPGFVASKPPNPECPECWGEGKGMPLIKDTRHLSPGAAMLYEGVKVTKDGMQVLIADRMKAVEMLGRHLGMWTEKALAPDAVNPLHALLTELQAKGSALPIVHADPEATDVASRPAAKPTTRGSWKAAPTKGKA